MIKSIKSTFEKTTVILDNHYYEECTFKDCIIVYAGTSEINLVGCKFFDCQWRLDGAASNTIQFLRSMYKDMGEFGKQTVEAKFENIKK
ncbi:hypothetical protein FD733_03805 [Pantoea sp. Eser]|nr:hypothetical protein [Pantoea sp. Eser]